MDKNVSTNTFQIHFQINLQINLQMNLEIYYARLSERLYIDSSFTHPYTLISTFHKQQYVNQLKTIQKNLLKFIEQSWRE